MTEQDLLAALGGSAISFEVASGVCLEVKPLALSDALSYHSHRQANPDDHMGAVVRLMELSVRLPGGGALSADTIRALPASAVERITDRIAKLNGWGDGAGN